MSNEYKHFRLGFSPLEYNPRDKRENVANHILYMLSRTQSMFGYEGLPDSIPQRELEYMLQTNGNVCIAEHNGNIYAFTGAPGGEPDAYYRPTLYTVANAGLKFSHVYRINKDCVIIPNDSMYLGLIPLFSKYATLLSESELSLFVALINARLVSLITASNQNVKLAMDKMLSDIEEGKLASILDKSIEGLGNIKALPYTQGLSRTFTELIEVIQYNKASWYNDIGLNANWNAKRESIVSSESELNDDALFPLVDDMLRCRENALEKVNTMFGLNISVKLNSAWEDNQKEVDLEQEQLEGDSKRVEGGEDDETENVAGGDEKTSA